MWQWNKTSWEQDKDGCAFILKTLDGCECESKIAAPLDRLLGAKTHPPAGEAACADKIFPAEFSHCPNCGVALLDNDTDKDNSEAWIPPYGPGNGLKILSNKKPTINENGKSLKGGEAFLLPSEKGGLSFFSSCMGGKRPLLIALRKAVGEVWVYHPNSKKKNEWQLLKGKFGDADMPNWSWTLAFDKEEKGFAAPSNKGPVWVTVDWALNSLVISPSTGGKSIGSPVRIGTFVLAPILREGKFVVLSRKDNAGEWQECTSSDDPTCVMPQLCRETAQEAFLGIPVVGKEEKFVYWLCRGGYIKVSVLDTGPGEWSFHVWGTDTQPPTALIELSGPYQKKDSRSGSYHLWQLCEAPDPTSSRDEVIYKIIKFDGDEYSGSEKVECGQFVR